MVLPLILAGRLSPMIRFLCLLPAMGWWLLFFMLGTRGTLLACAVAFPLTYLYYRRQSLPWLRWQAWAVFGGLSLYLLFYVLLPKIFGIAATSALSQGFAGRDFTTSTGRLKLWSVAIEMSGQHPWLGVGPMHYADDAVSYAAHPHNAILQIAAEWGLPALVIVLILFVIGLRVWLHAGPGSVAGHEQNQEEKLQPALFAALLTAAVHAMFDGIIVTPVSLTMMTLVLGWMIGITCARSDNQILAWRAYLSAGIICC
jgi:putative inorganic carbon (hco3(-)) transporter